MNNYKKIKKYEYKFKEESPKKWEGVNKNNLEESVKTKMLKFSLVEPSDPDVGFAGVSNAVTLTFDDNIIMENRDFSKFIKELEIIFKDWILERVGYVERIK